MKQGWEIVSIGSICNIKTGKLDANASIVPDGVLFGTSTGHLAIRKEIVDKQRLQAVISMPSGVFKPYAGVSTAILVFTKTKGYHICLE